MAKMWAGLTSGITDNLADSFNSSIAFDYKLYRQDIKGSLAHAAMLGAQGILPVEDVEQITRGLEAILGELDAGTLEIDSSSEDIHMFVEEQLTLRLGDVGKKLHTARSRNDQVAVDMRLYMRESCGEIRGLICALLEVLTRQAEAHAGSIMPGYTHLQRAQPVTFGHHLMAYAMMLLRDLGRLDDAVRRMNKSPLGCGALAGTTYNIDREMTAAALGFDGVALNSLDGVSDRDFCVEIMSCIAILMMHLSRLGEELVLWSSWEFQFIRLSDSYTTGSSMMPQKRNPDMAELVRGKTGRVYGDLMALLTTLKGLPLAYNKDTQEDKGSVFDALETAKICLEVTAPMIATMTVNTEVMYKAAGTGFINATDLADYLVEKGLPFRDAYKISGQVVAECMAQNATLETLPLESYKAYSALFEEDLYQAVNLHTCVEKRVSQGGTSPASVMAQVEYVKGWLKNDKSLY